MQFQPLTTTQVFLVEPNSCVSATDVTVGHLKLKVMVSCREEGSLLLLFT